MIRTAIAAATILIPSIAPAEGIPIQYWTDSSALVTNCRAFMEIQRNPMVGSQTAHEAGACYGYVAGALEALGAEQMLETSVVGGEICLPASVRLHAMIEVVANYVDATPQERHLPPYLLVRQALSKAYAF